MDKPEPTAPSSAPEGSTRLLAAADRRRILSGFRIKLVFTLFSGAVILGLSMLVFLLVDSIFDTIRRLHEAGTTILLVEQNARMALQVADRGYVIQTGEVILSDRADNLRENESVQKAYLGVA